jgi:hypothetical protein
MNLAIDLGPVDDTKLENALTAIWAHADLNGCYLHHDREPAEQTRVAPGKEPGLDTCLRGVARLGALAPVTCSTIVVREDGRSDWLYFGLPLGSLRTALPVGAFPFEDGRDLSWRSSVDGWLCSIAQKLLTAQRFRLGLVGWTDGLDNSTDELLEKGVPEERWVGYLVPSGSALTWCPPNQGPPMCVDRR